MLQNFAGRRPVAEKLAMALGPRDNAPEPGPFGARGRRAQRNFEESLFFFLPAASLLIQLGRVDGLGLTGAWMFAGARVAYLPAYLSGIAGVRSLVWMIGAAGIAVMLVAVAGPQ